MHNSDDFITMHGTKRFWTVEAVDGHRHVAAPGQYQSEQAAKKARARIPHGLGIYYYVKGWIYRPPSGVKHAQ